MSLKLKAMGIIQIFHFEDGKSRLADAKVIGNAVLQGNVLQGKVSQGNAVLQNNKKIMNIFNFSILSKFKNLER